MSLPPVFAASALYDSLLQAALRQFFSRATFETEPIPSLSSDGRLAIEPTSDPSVLTIRWFGSRHVLHVPARRPFTAHEVRLARAIGTVLAARYRAIFDPKQMLERGDLFRGAIEDRYVGAFLDSGASSEPTTSRADLIATAIEVLRVAALSSYENRAISSGVLMLGGDDDPARPRHIATDHAYRYSQSLTDDQEFLPAVRRHGDAVSRQPDGVVLDIVEVARYAAPTPLECHARRATGRTRWRPRQPATSASCSALRTRSRCSPTASRRSASGNARWHLLDLQAKYEMWEAAVGNGRWPNGCSRPHSTSPIARRRAVRRAARSGDRPATARRPGRSTRCRPAHRGDRADARPTAAHAARPNALRARSRRPRRARQDGWRDGDGCDRPAARRRRDPPPCRTTRAALQPRRRRRANHRGDGRRPLRRRPQGQRGRADHVLRSAGEDLGYLTLSCQLSAVSYELSAIGYQIHQLQTSAVRRSRGVRIRKSIAES